MSLIGDYFLFFGSKEKSDKEGKTFELVEVVKFKDECVEFMMNLKLHFET